MRKAARRESVVDIPGDDALRDRKDAPQVRHVAQVVFGHAITFGEGISCMKVATYSALANAPVASDSYFFNSSSCVILTSANPTHCRVNEGNINLTERKVNNGKPINA